MTEPASEAPAAAGENEPRGPLDQNARDLGLDLAWLVRLLDARFELYFTEDSGLRSVFDVEPPALPASGSPYARFVQHYELSFAERAAVILALTPHIRPQLLDVFFTRNKTFDRPFTEFGGRPDASGSFIPTGETLAFLLGADDMAVRLALHALFDRDHFLQAHDILRPPGAGESWLKTRLELSEEALSLLTVGRAPRPAFGADFPARAIETELTWDDLVLHPSARRQIDEITTWLEHRDTLMNEWGMGPKLRPGYRALFHGPPGTGKTMTACLLGRSTGREVYKIDLSLVVSKYIGETEKNLARVFDRAQRKGWILFFDEADALFGKRTETRDAHDRYANQEVSFLLQRVETFDGIAILATNQKENMDSAFARRFESMIYFPMPRAEERVRLWKQAVSPKARCAADLDLEKMAQQYELSGGAIVNVVRYASLQALARGERVLALEDVVQGVRRELAKEGKGG